MSDTPKVDSVYYGGERNDVASLVPLNAKTVLLLLLVLDLSLTNVDYQNTWLLNYLDHLLFQKY